MTLSQRLRTPRVLLAGGAALLLAGVVVTADGLLRIRGMQQELAAVESDVARLRGETVQLAETVERLRNDPQTIERLAREELGWVRKGETILKFPASPK